MDVDGYFVLHTRRKRILLKTRVPPTLWLQQAIGEIQFYQIHDSYDTVYGGQEGLPE